MSFKHLALCLTLNLFFSFFLKGFTEDLSKLNVFFGEKAPIVSSFLSEVNGELSKKQKEKSNSIKSQLNEKQITIFDNLIQEKIGSSTSPDQVKIEPVKSSVSNSGSPITNSNIKKYSKRTSYTSKSEIIEREEKPPKKNI